MSANNQINGVPEYFQLQAPIMTRILIMEKDFKDAKYAENIGNDENGYIKYFMYKYESYENFEILLKQKWDAYNAIEKEHNKEDKKYIISYDLDLA